MAEPRFRRSGPPASEPLRAKFPSRCPECDERIEIDDPITKGPEDLYIHEECA